MHAKAGENELQAVDADVADENFSKQRKSVACCCALHLFVSPKLHDSAGRLRTTPIRSGHFFKQTRGPIASEIFQLSGGPESILACAPRLLGNETPAGVVVFEGDGTANQVAVGIFHANRPLEQRMVERLSRIHHEWISRICTRRLDVP